VHVRDRVQKMITEGVIEKFTLIVNPEKIGSTVSAFFDVEVDPQGIEAVAEDLARQPEVRSLYIMSDMASLHIHTLTEDSKALEDFAHRNLFFPQTCREGQLQNTAYASQEPPRWSSYLAILHFGLLYPQHCWSARGYSSAVG